MAGITAGTGAQVALTDAWEPDEDTGRFLRYRAVVYDFIDSAFGLNMADPRRPGGRGPDCAGDGAGHGAPGASRYATYDALAARPTSSARVGSVLPEDIAIDIDFMSFMSNRAYQAYLVGDMAHLATVLELQFSFACAHLLDFPAQDTSQHEEPTPLWLARAFCAHDAQRMGEMLGLR